MEFKYDPNSPCAYEGWMTKGSDGFLERWQRRYFRLQKKCIYYFKKEEVGVLPCGYIPLIDIEVKEVERKGKRFVFSIKLLKQPEYAKRFEYFIYTDSDQQRKQWINKIMENQAYSIVGESFQLATEISTTGHNAHNLIPYFITPILQQMDNSGYKLRNVWTIEIPFEIIKKGVAALNCNFLLNSEDIHNALGIILYYFNKLPDGFIPCQEMEKFEEKVTVEDIKALIRNAPAPVRELLKELGFNFQKVMQNSENNRVNIFALIPVVGPILIRPPPNSTLWKYKIKGIQDSFAECFLSNIPKIFEDIHQFLDAPRLPVLKRARVIQNIEDRNDAILYATKGLLVYVVREDSYGWCTVYTSNRRVGLLHSSYLKPLTQEEENELNTGQNIDTLMDIVREKCPEIMILLDGMNNEVALLNNAMKSFH